MVKKKILLVGAGGMLGKALGQAFKEETVTAWDRAELDITQAASVREQVGKVQPEIIINAAAYTNVDGAEADREAAWAVNVRGVINMAAAAKEAGATLVHYSTDYVFPGDRAAGYSEDDNPGPAVNVYGESKLAGEQAVRESGNRYYLIRTAWLYGPGGKNFVDTILKLGAEKNELSVINDQHGSPTYTYDLARYTKELLENHWSPGVYHATNAGVTTWYDFAREIFRLAGQSVLIKPVPSSDYPRPARRPAWSVLLNTKGPKMRGWPEALRGYLSQRD